MKSSDDASNYRTFTDLQTPATHKFHQGKGYGSTWAVFALIAAWFFLGGQFNIDNKKAVKLTPAPLTICVIQLWVGTIFFVPLWILRVRAVPTFASATTFLKGMGPQTMGHLMCHLGGIASMGAGAVAFTHIIKAGEPATTAFLSIIVLGQFFSTPSYLALIPVITGVGLACWGNIYFTWYAFITAMISNLGASFRSVFAKKLMSRPSDIGEHLDESNIYAVMTLISIVIATPIAFALEGFSLFHFWLKNAVPGDGNNSAWMVWYIFSSGATYQLYNECSFHALGRISQLSHAVANTLRRVYIIAYAILIFGTPLTWTAMTGSGIAIIGTFLFSLARMYYH